MDRSLGFAALLVAVLLLATGSYSATLSTMSYQDGSRFEHRIDPVGSDGYAERVEDIEAETDRNASELPAKRYDELPADVRRVFDRTLADDPDRRGTRTFTPTFCKPDVVACPHSTPRDLPDELEYRTTDGEYAALHVQTDDGRYLFSTPAAVPGHGTPVLDLTELHRLAFSPIFGAAALFFVALGTEAFVVGRRRLAAFGVGAATVTSAFAWNLGFGPLLLAVPAAIATWAPAPLADRRTRAASIALGVAIPLVAVGPAYALAYAGVLGPSPFQRGLVAVLALCGPLALYLLDRRLRTSSASATSGTPTGSE